MQILHYCEHNRKYSLAILLLKINIEYNAIIIICETTEHTVVRF